MRATAKEEGEGFQVDPGSIGDRRKGVGVQEAQGCQPGGTRELGLMRREQKNRVLMATTFHCHV